MIIKTKKIGMEAVAQAVEEILCDSITLIPNPDSEKTYFSFPTRNDVKEFRKQNKSFF